MVIAGKTSVWRIWKPMQRGGNHNVLEDLRHRWGKGTLMAQYTLVWNGHQNVRSEFLCLYLKLDVQT